MAVPKFVKTRLLWYSLYHYCNILRFLAKKGADSYIKTGKTVTVLIRQRYFFYFKQSPNLCKRFYNHGDTICSRNHRKKRID